MADRAYELPGLRSGISLEQQARDLLNRLGMPDAQEMTAGEVVELANIIGALYRAQLIARDTERQIDRLALCPDHRDKATGRCIVCQAEERTRQEIRDELSRGKE